MTDPKPEIAVTELLPCPLCLSTSIKLEPYSRVIGVSDDAAPNIWMVYCDEDEGGCELNIIRTTPETAAVAWNARSQHQPDDATSNIVAWLRADADLTEIEGRKIVANSHGISVRDIADWQSLVATKRGLADAIERGDHLKS